MRHNDSLADFSISVASQGYEWKETDDGPVLVELPANGARSRTYYPFSEEHKLLFLRFSQLKTKDAILAFANQYGFQERR